MKKLLRILYYSLAGVLFLTGMSSCNDKKFLKVDQYSLLAADQMFKTADQAKGGLVGCYTMMLPDNTDGDWGIKPNLFIGGHPTMDTQATGWDKDWNQQNWTPGSPELLGGWKHAYNAITRCNDFLAGLEAADNAIINADLKKSLDGQARGIRAGLQKRSVVCRCWQQEKITLTLRLKPVLRILQKCGISSLQT